MILKMFGIDESHCTIWWKMVQEKAEKLWRIMLMRMLRNDCEEYQNEREKRLLTYIDMMQSVVQQDSKVEQGYRHY